MNQERFSRTRTRARARTRLRLLFVALVTSLPLIATGFAPAWAATGQITGYGGKCVDIAAASSANGTKVQLYSCNGTNAQQWTVGTDGTVRAKTSRLGPMTWVSTCSV